MTDNLEGKILIAPPKMRDYRFSKTVLYCWKHNVGGAAAVIINRPIKKPTFKEVCRDSGMPEPKNMDAMMWYGGPVGQNMVGLLHSKDMLWTSSNQTPDLAFTLDRKAIEDITIRQPKQYLICLGMASWNPGQLEDELDSVPPRHPYESWLVSDYDPFIVFNGHKENLWKHAVERSVKNYTRSFTDKMFKK